METVTVSKKYQIVIPEKLRKKTGIKPGDKMVSLSKHGVLQYIPICLLSQTKGFILGLDTEKLRDDFNRTV
jgi:AbrB family looped-hinge helix DNA binding protein